jgi:hypothetical protein
MRPRFHPADHGDFYAEPNELIGHWAADVMAWLSEHPDYDASITYRRWDFEGEVDVTDQFFGEDAVFLPSPVLAERVAAE